MGDEDKQFEATPQKLQNARKEGQVVKSKDASMAFSLVVMFSMLYYIAPAIWEQIAKLFQLLYAEIPNKELDEIGFVYLLFIVLIPMVVIIGPVLFMAFLSAALADFFQVGPLLTVKPLIPKADKINPVKGVKNIFSSKTLVELVKNILKVVIMGFIAWMTFQEHLPKMLMLGATENVFPMLQELGDTLIIFVIRSGIFFLLISGGDYLFQRWKFLKDQKMSFKEIKDEYKNSEGDPHVKAALRQKRMQMLQQAMLEAIPEADVVITNPLHIAVAIKYEKDKMEAPRVVAKGSELFAKKIVELAKTHQIPVVENIPVARALYKIVDLNREIPPELYKSVAEILLFVYNLKEKRQRKTV
ncbi:MAG: flagellar biosynthesis protein FlhB [Vampirovibrionia bacterium]